MKPALYTVHMISVKLFRSPDSIPAYFLKRIAAPIFNVLSYLFMLTLTQGTVNQGDFDQRGDFDHFQKKVRNVPKICFSGVALLSVIF